MKQVFQLKKGEITINDEEIIINDQAERENRRWLFSSGIWTIYGIASVGRYFTTGDQFLLWSGLLIGILHCINFIIRIIFRSTTRQIKLQEIDYIKIKQRFNNRFLEIKLLGNKVRRINQIQDIEEDLKPYLGRYSKSK
ncbi:hypothetical protein [Xanthovirga aplysinae]|uniref:hypothetical protein n=1 Tax=Xanthovirga aplysinae TaxID=2529853 RepID=UPI0012BC1A57|nr:hypothetical protein [Xanthovirga aplysinae]MTI32291.1 hypothetical protein [Xanthovirga aplysinae]